MTNKKCTLILSSNFKKQYKKVFKQVKDLDKIDEYPLRPDVLKEVLKENKFPVHKINID